MRVCDSMGNATEREERSWAIDLPPDYASDEGLVTMPLAEAAEITRPLSDFSPGERCLLVVPGLSEDGSVSFEPVTVLPSSSSECTVEVCPKCGSDDYVDCRDASSNCDWDGRDSTLAVHCLKCGHSEPSTRRTP